VWFDTLAYAVALKKEVITLTDRHENLPFDIRDRHAIAYASDIASARKQLAAKLDALTKTLPPDYTLAPPSNYPIRGKLKK
jgi:hypothetical protein